MANTTRRNYDKPDLNSLFNSFELLGNTLDKIDSDVGKLADTIEEGCVFEPGVVTGDVVYKHASGFYNKVIADGSVSNDLPGVANITTNTVTFTGIVSSGQPFAIGKALYLSDTVAGVITDIKTSVFLGVSIGNSKIYKAPPDFRKKYSDSNLLLPSPGPTDAGKPIKVAFPYTNGYVVSDDPSLPVPVEADDKKVPVYDHDTGKFILDHPIPVGTVVRAGKSLPGFLPTTGAMVDIAAYPKLYNEIADSFNYFNNKYIEGSPWKSQWRTNYEEPNLNDWSLPSLDIPRIHPTVTRLGDGRFLVIGGSTTDKRVFFYSVDINGKVTKTRCLTDFPVTIITHTTTLLGDGRLLVVGGDIGAGAVATTYFGTITGNSIAWVSGTAITTVTMLHTTTLLGDGRILVLGGYNASAYVNLSYFGTISGNTITWVAGTVLPQITGYHTTTLLSDGRIMMAGGFAAAAVTNTYFGTISGNTITWAAGTALPIAIYSLNSVFLSDNTVMILGGYDGTLSRQEVIIGSISTNTITWTVSTSLLVPRHGFDIIFHSDKLYLFGGGSTTAALGVQYTSGIAIGSYNPSTGKVTWNTTKWYGTVLAASRALHTANLLKDGRILVIGGFDGSSAKQDTIFMTSLGRMLTQVAGTNITTVVQKHASVVLNDGRVLVTGGQNATVATNLTYFGTILGNTITWAAGTNMSLSFYNHTCTLLPDGRILLIGGFDGTNVLSNTYFGTIAGNVITWAAGTAYPMTINNHTTTILSDGRILVIGGSTTGGAARANTYLGTITGNSIDWVASTDYPMVIKQHGAIISADNRVFVTGGNSVLATTYSQAYLGLVTDNTITWTQVSNAVFIDRSSLIKDDYGTYFQIGGYKHDVIHSRCACHTIDLVNHKMNGLMTRPTGYTAIYTHNMVITNNKVHIIGGAIAGGTSTTNFYSGSVSSDGSLDQLTLGTAIPAGLQRFAIAVCKDKIYIIGGWTTASVATVYQATIAADGTIGTFSAYANSLPAAVSGIRAFVTHSRIFVTSCWTTAPTNAVYTAPIYPDGSIGPWTTDTSLPAVNAYGTIIDTNFKVYLVGGHTTVSVNTVYSAIVYPDGTLGKWVQEPNLPIACQRSAAYVCNKRVFLFCGCTTVSVTTLLTAPISNDGSLGEWEYLDNLPFALSDIDIVVTSKYLHVMGGIAAAASSMEYSLELTGGKQDYTYDNYRPIEPLSGKFYLPDTRFEDSQLAQGLRGYIKY